MNGGTMKRKMNHVRKVEGGHRELAMMRMSYLRALTNDLAFDANLFPRDSATRRKLQWVSGLYRKAYQAALRRGHRDAGRREVV